MQGTVYSRAFSGIYEMVCDRCGTLLLISRWDPAINYLAKRHGLHPVFGPDHFGEVVGSYLRSCP